MQEENKDQNTQVNQLKELDKIKDHWKETIVTEASEQFNASRARAHTHTHTERERERRNLHGLVGLGMRWAST